MIKTPLQDATAKEVAKLAFAVLLCLIINFYSFHHTLYPLVVISFWHHFVISHYVLIFLFYWDQADLLGTSETNKVCFLVLICHHCLEKRRSQNSKHVPSVVSESTLSHIQILTSPFHRCLTLGNLLHLLIFPYL